MASLIPEHVIEQVRQAHDVQEVVGRYVELKQAGRAFKGLCPFHDEKTPSFTVNPDRQTFKCFGCGEGGNVFTFLMKHQGMTFPDAVRMLADERAIEVPSVSGAQEDRGRMQRLRQALDFAQSFFVAQLKGGDGAQARAYLTQRGYEESAVDAFELGFAPPGWDRLLEAATRRGIKADVLFEAGLVQERKERNGHYDRFRNRVIFPIRDLQGRVVTFGARALLAEDTPKYLNGPETPVFKKSNLLYGLDHARLHIARAGEALLMEGYTDVLMARMHGFENAVAGMGTAFTDRQAALLRRAAGRVVLVYDSDDAGRVAAERALDVLLSEGLEVRIALLPEGRDVDEILLEDGAPAFQAVLDDSLEFFDFKLATLSERLGGLDTPRNLAAAAEELTPLITKVKSQLERDLLFRRLGERMGGPDAEALLRREAVRRMGGTPTSRSRRAPARAAGASADPAAELRPESQRQVELLLLAGVLFLPQLKDRVFNAVGPEHFTLPVTRRLYNAVLEIDEAGGEAGATDDEPTVNVHTLIGRFANDDEAASTLSALPEPDPTLEERVTRAIEHLEQSRRHRRQQDHFTNLVRQVAGETSPSPIPPVEGAPAPEADAGPTGNLTPAEDVETLAPEPEWEVVDSSPTAPLEDKLSVDAPVSRSVTEGRMESNE